jgi:PAS domain S-box-containing protein
MQVQKTPPGEAAPGPRRPAREDAIDPAELLDLAHDAIFVRTFDDRRITYWNRGAERMYGWTRSQALGRVPAELLDTSYPVPLEQIEAILAKGGRWEGELRHTARDGRRLHVLGRWTLQRSGDGAPLAILETNSDVTAQKEAEEELQASNQLFRLLVLGVVDYAIFMLDPDGRIASWNEGAQRIKGYAPEEIIGRHFSVFYPRQDVESGKPGWELEIAEREGRFEDEGWRLRKDGSRFWANVVITALRDEEGRLRGFAKVTRDITARREQEQRAELEREREAEQLREHAARMAELEKSKTQFLNLASHELRGPLAVVRGYVSMLEDGTIPPEKVGEVAPLLEVKLQQMELLVQQMLETARLESNVLQLKLERFDLGREVAQVVDSFRPLGGPVHPLRLWLPREPVWVVADRPRVTTIVANLVDNAIKYSPHGGPIEVTVRGDPRWASVSVRDWGIGIPEADREKLFRRFGRVVPEELAISGTGLGLFLSREMARRHGGDLLLESAPVRGSCFTLRLPVGVPGEIGGLQAASQ